MRMAFLLGSGASIRAGMPSTSEITQEVLKGDGIRVSPDGHYFLGRPTDPGPDPLERAQIEASVKLTNLLHTRVSGYYQCRQTHPTNYESLAYVLTQVRDTISGEFDNPAVQALVKSLEEDSEVQALLTGGKELSDILGKAASYVCDVVSSHLRNKDPQETAYLEFIAQAAQYSKGPLYVFTLNHDRVLDEFLTNRSMPYADGFGPPINEIKYWEGELWPKKGKHVVVVKLHGSIQWFSFGRPWGQEVGTPLLGVDPDQSLDKSGNLQHTSTPRPLLLIGTFNKMYSYTSRVFADLHCCFHNVLNSSDALISVGYGFGDKGINTKLVQWLNSPQERRLIVVHPNPADLRSCARGAIVNQWDEWKGRGKLYELHKKAEELSWKSDLEGMCAK